MENPKITIEEWDGELSQVEVLEEEFTYVVIRYDDGVTHEVSPEYLNSIRIIIH